MKISTLKIFIFFLIIQTANAQTDTVFIDCPGVVGGTWTPEHHYIARCNVTVPYDSILVIQPGVKIEFQEGFSFKVEGQLNAVGNANSRIEITPYDETWKGISFGTPSGETEVNTSLLAFADIDCGSSSGNSEAVVLGKHHIAYLNNLHITNAGTAIKIGGFADIENVNWCSFQNLTQGIVFEYCDIVDKAEVQSCFFTNILDKAIVVSQNQAFLEEISISGCNFDNSGLAGNHSESAIYITLNNILGTISLTGNQFDSFALNDNAPACIYIYENAILSQVTLNQNEINGCGGEEPTSPNADFGGIFINKCENVSFNENTFSANTGKKSGAGYLDAGKIYFSGNSILENRNNYTGNENYAGAFTLKIAERFSAEEDVINFNSSAKSGGAMYIEATGTAALDVFLSYLYMEGNNASNEGGAILINSALDTLSIDNSEIYSNYSSAGSGGFLSLITAEFSSLIIEQNYMLDNFVSENSFGGFLFLRHNPSVVPSYGNVRFYKNNYTVSNHNSTRNYSILYSLSKTFPGSIILSGEDAMESFPVSGNLYHFERLADGPAAPEENVSIALTECEFDNNRCPLFYFENDSSIVNIELVQNKVDGDPASFGNFVTIECKEASSVLIERENYKELISGTSGGAVSIHALKETGDVLISNIMSENCFSVDGDGGHIALVSGSSDPAASQSLTILESTFSNSGINETTGGNGGGIYIKTPGKIDSVLVRSCTFEALKTGEGGGALYLDCKEADKVDIEGTAFSNILSEGGDGALCINAGNGNIRTLSVVPYEEINTTFQGCTAQQNGGAISVTASKELGGILFESVEVTSTSANEGDGGHFALISQASDAAISQNLVISNSVFENNNNNINGGKGGAFYYSTPGNLDSLSVKNSSFTSFKTESEGGSIFAEAKEIGRVSLMNSLFDGAASLNASGGAISIHSTNGNIGLVENSGCTFRNCNAKIDGGAGLFNSSAEIGSVMFDGLISEKCFATTGNGGHFALVSGSENPNTPQQFLINGSEFSNAGITSVTGGQGGAIYYETPGNPDSLNLVSSQFTGLKSGGNGGAVSMLVKRTSALNILGNTYSGNSALEKGGAVYISAGNGNIGKIYAGPVENISTTFTGCSADSDGGALCAVASGEIGLAVFDEISIEDCYSGDGNGGHIALTSQGADGALTQSLEISGSAFSNSGISEPTGENGGVIFYNALSDISSITIDNSSFSDVSAVKDGGSVHITAGKVDELNLSASLFSSSLSEVLSGGACYVRTQNGLLSGNITSNRFINCTSGEMGGSLYLEDSKFDNSEESVNWANNLFRREFDQVVPETGGAIYCKGINSISFESDSSISQSAGSAGGFLYLENVYNAAFEKFYSYGNNADKGGVLYHKGDAQSIFDQSCRIFNSTFLFNTAETTGACFYITDIDSVEIGTTDNKNNFVANQALSAATGDQIGGGVLFVQNAGSLKIRANSFYTNQAAGNGGIGIISNITSGLEIAENSLLSNRAKAGGAFALTGSFADGVIEMNNFSSNSSTEQGGALLLSPSATKSITINDNTFYKNNAAKWGGAVSTYRPVDLVRNLFRENMLYDVNPNLPHKGAALYLDGEGNMSLLKNCVFDQNYYEPVEEVPSVYFDNLPSAFPPVSISNCSFFNFSDTHYSVFNASDNDTLRIENTIFTIRDNMNKNRDGVVYFNETIKSRYSDLIYSLIHDTVNFNYDEYIYFNSGDYYFDSTQFPVDMGNPDPAFNDFHFPPAYRELTNDMGVSGGPDNPDTNSVFLFHEPVDLPNNFSIIVTSKDCFDYTFKCVGEFVETYDYFYWFMPDSIYVTEEPFINYTFDHSLTGDVTITALGHDLSNAEVYGFGQYLLNMDIIRIYGVSTSYPDNVISVSSVPISFTITSNIYHENDTPYEWGWTVTDAQGTEYTISGSEGSATVDIASITATPASMTVQYTLEACGRVLNNSIIINFEVDQNLWGYPEVVFFPSSTDIQDTTSFFTATFSKIMTKAGGNLLTVSDIDSYLQLTQPYCPSLGFEKSITYTATQTIFRFDRIKSSTGQPDTLCNGDYNFELNCSELFTQYYKLSIGDAAKEYLVSNNFIFENQNTLAAEVYPNPFRDQVTMNFEKEGDYMVRVSDLQGNVVFSALFEQGKTVILPLKNLPDGLYILNALEKNGELQFNVKINKITY